MQPRNLLMYRPNATEAVSVSLQLCARSAKTSIKVSYNCTKQNMSKSPNNTNTNTNNNNSPAEVKAKIRKCLETPHCGVIRDQKWQGKLITKRWDDEDLSRIISRVCLNCVSKCYQQDCTRARRYALPRKVKFFADCAVSFQSVPHVLTWLSCSGAE